MTEPLRVGVIGAGAVAQVAHLPVLTRRSDVEVSAICDNDVAKAQALADRFRIESVYDDIEELLRHDTPDAIVVCTPNHLHGAHVRTGLSAGVHVLCDRPLAFFGGGGLAM